jgi:hypothetical protein
LVRLGRRYARVYHGRDTIKGRSLARDGRLSVCVDDERSPFAFVIIEGHVELIDDLTEVRAWATRIGSRYRYCGAVHRRSGRR